MREVQCQECKNVKQLAEDEAKKGRWWECGYCGATYEITNVTDAGVVESEMVEEEK